MTELYSAVSAKNCSFNYSKYHISSSYAFIAAYVDVVTLVQFIHMTISSSVSSHMEGLQSWPSVPQPLETPYLTVFFEVKHAK